jgi:hypothetical protein
MSERAPVKPCECGCGLPAPIAKWNSRRDGSVKGRPLRYIHGHNARRDPTAFWAQVNKNGPIIRPELGACWIWTGTVDANGYGRLMINGRLRQATHIALELEGYFILWKTLKVMHHCDNPPCVRPSHLRIDTQPANVADMVSKGRQSRGEDRPLAKLDPAKVQEIRALYQRGIVGRGLLALAKQFNVAPWTIKGIVSGKTWTDVKPTVRD